MKKALLTTAIIASLGSAAVAQGIAPVTTTSGQNSALTVGSLSQVQVIAVIAAVGITVAAVVALAESSDGT